MFKLTDRSMFQDPLSCMTKQSLETEPLEPPHTIGFWSTNPPDALYKFVGKSFTVQLKVESSRSMSSVLMPLSCGEPVTIRTLVPPLYVMVGVVDMVVGVVVPI